MNGTTSLVNAAKVLKVSTRRLKETLLAAEKSSGVSVLIRAGSQSGKGTRYHVQWSVLRQYAPHLFPTDDLVHAGAVELGVQSQLGSVRDGFSKLVEQVEELTARLRRLEVEVRG